MPGVDLATLLTQLGAPAAPFSPAARFVLRSDASVEAGRARLDVAMSPGHDAPSGYLLEGNWELSWAGEGLASARAGLEAKTPATLGALLQDFGPEGLHVLLPQPLSAASLHGLLFEWDSRSGDLLLAGGGSLLGVTSDVSVRYHRANPRRLRLDIALSAQGSALHGKSLRALLVALDLGLRADDPMFEWLPLLDLEVAPQQLTTELALDPASAGFYLGLRLGDPDAWADLGVGIELREGGGGCTLRYEGPEDREQALTLGATLTKLLPAAASRALGELTQLAGPSRLLESLWATTLDRFVLSVGVQSGQRCPEVHLQSVVTILGEQTGLHLDLLPEGPALRLAIGSEHSRGQSIPDLAAALGIDLGFASERLPTTRLGIRELVVDTARRSFNVTGIATHGFQPSGALKGYEVLTSVELEAAPTGYRLRALVDAEAQPPSLRALLEDLRLPELSALVAELGDIELERTAIELQTQPRRLELFLSAAITFEDFIRKLAGIDTLPEGIPARLSLNGLRVVLGEGGELELSGVVELQGAEREETVTLGPTRLDLARLSVALKRSAGGADLSCEVELSGEPQAQLAEALRVDNYALGFSYEKSADAGQRWKLHGALGVTLGDLPTQQLRAEVGNAGARFSLAPATPLCWRVPELFEMELRQLALGLSRPDQGDAAEWFLETSGGLKLGDLLQVSGSLGLRAAAGAAAFEFTADEAHTGLRVPIPLVPGDPKMTITAGFSLRRFALMKRASWSVEAESELSLTLPELSTGDETLDAISARIRQLISGTRKATLKVSDAGASMTASGFPLIPLPIPSLDPATGQWRVHEGGVGLDDLQLKLGQSASGGATLKLRIPEGVNHVFGTGDDGRPSFPLLKGEFAVALSFDERSGLGLQLESLPIDLSCEACFRQEPEGDRVWTRFTLGPLSLRWGCFEDPEDGKSWLHLDFGELGALRLLSPRLSFNGIDFYGSGGFEILEELAIPLTPLRALLIQLGAKDLAETLPARLPLVELNVLNEALELDVEGFLRVIGELCRTLGLEIPLDPLRDVLAFMAQHTRKLPLALRDYLRVRLPKKLIFDLAITPSAGMGIKVNIQASPDAPLRILWPMVQGLMGITLRGFSLGEIFSGTVIVVDVDMDFDVFDFFTLAASLAVPEEIARELTRTEDIQRSLVIRKLLTLVVITPVAPIPIPVWFEELGMRSYGLEGLGAKLSVVNALADFSIGRAARGLGEVFRELRAFFAESDAQLPPKLLSKHGLNPGIRVEPGQLELPRYLGGAKLGSEETLFSLGLEELVVPLANFCKAPELRKLVDIVPPALRSAGFDAGADFGFGPLKTKSAWLLGTEVELAELAEASTKDGTPFLAAVYSDGPERGDARLAAARALHARATTAGARDGLVFFSFGRLALPGVDTVLEGASTLVVDRGQVGALLRFEGAVGDLLRLDVQTGVRVGLEPSPHIDLRWPEENHIYLDVAGHRALSTRIWSEGDDLCFQGQLELLPASSGMRAGGGLEGRFGPGTFRIHGGVEIALPPLPASSAVLDLSPSRVALDLRWLDQPWSLELFQSSAGQLRFEAHAPAPLALLPGRLVLRDPTQSQAGPQLSLAVGDPYHAVLRGQVELPAIQAVAAADLVATPGKIQLAAAARIRDRFEGTLMLLGHSLEPGELGDFAFQLQMQGDLLQALTEAMAAELQALSAAAHEALDQAQALFEAEWAKLREAVKAGVHSARAHLLQMKHEVEGALAQAHRLIGTAIEAARVKDEEIAARKAILRQLRDGAQAPLQTLIDAVEAAKRELASLEKALAEHEHWYHHTLDAHGRFWLAVPYGVKHAALVVARDGGQAILSALQAELQRAKDTVPVIVDGADQVLQALDRVRNGFLAEVDQLNGQVADRYQELAQLNDMLALAGDALLEALGQAVDRAALDAAEASFALARLPVKAFDEAAAFITQHARPPFTVESLKLRGFIGSQRGARFQAEAGVTLSFFPEPRYLPAVALEVDFDDLAGSAAGVARALWQRRDELGGLVGEAARKAREKDRLQVEALRHRLGEDFGEPTEKKLLVDMDWSELARFYYTVKRDDLGERYPEVLRGLQEVAATVDGLDRASRELCEPIVCFGDMSGPMPPPEKRAGVIALRQEEQSFKALATALSSPPIHEQRWHLASVFAPQREAAETFFVAADGHLAYRYWSEGVHIDSTSLAGAGPVRGMLSAVYSPVHQHAEVFVVGGDERLHHYWATGGCWYSEHAPFASAGAIRGELCAVYAPQREHSEVFAIGENGVLSYFYFVGGQWHRDTGSFAAHGGMARVRALYDAKQAHSEIFCVDYHSNLHRFHVVAGGWRHEREVFQPFGQVHGEMSAVYSPVREHSEIFFSSDSGYLRYLYRHADRWHVDTTSFAAAGQQLGAVAAVWNPVRAHSEVVCINLEGELHHFYVEAGAWRHEVGHFAPASAYASDLTLVFDPIAEHVELSYRDADGLLANYFFAGGRWRR